MATSAATPRAMRGMLPEDEPEPLEKLVTPLAQLRRTIGTYIKKGPPLRATRLAGGEKSPVWEHGSILPL